MSRPNLTLNDFMGLFRSGMLACLVVGSTTFAQQPAVPGGGVPAPSAVDTNAPAPAPVIPGPELTPGVDPSLVQPLPDTNGIPTSDTPHAGKPKPKKAATAAASPTLRGTVASIDKTNMTIVVHGKSKDETLSISSKTRIFADNKPAILSDAKEGENVVAEYRNTKEKSKEALLLRFGGGSGSGGAAMDHKGGGASADHKVAAEPAAKKPVKAAAKKPTKAASKKKKPANDTTTPAPDNGVTPLPGPTDTTIPVPNAGVPTPGTNVPAPGTPGV